MRSHFTRLRNTVRAFIQRAHRRAGGRTAPAAAHAAGQSRQAAPGTADAAVAAHIQVRLNHAVSWFNVPSSRHCTDVCYLYDNRCLWRLSATAKSLSTFSWMFIFRDCIRNVNYDMHTAQGAAVAAGLLAAPPGGAAAAASAVAGAGAAAAAAAPDPGWLEAEEAARQRSLARLAPLLNADGGIADPDKAGRF